MSPRKQRRRLRISPLPRWRSRYSGGHRTAFLSFTCEENFIVRRIFMKAFGFLSRRHVLAVSALVLFMLFTGAAPARALTLLYVGPAFNKSQCATHFSPSSACQDGDLTGSITFGGVSDTYSGTLTSTSITAWDFYASGIISMGTGDPIYAASFTLSSGQMSSWSFQAQKTAGTNVDGFTTVSGSGGYDDPFVLDLNTWTYSAAGWITVPPLGQWLNPKILGQPPRIIPTVPDETPPSPLAALPQSKPPCDDLSHCGDPVDIATGNVYEQVTDYTTVGQNPLAFIRYYNSMATQDTLATSLGRNWRHNYDRYLHAVSASEVDAERADGRVVAFIKVSGVWTPSADVDMTLTNSGSTYTLTDHDDSVETYTVSGSVGTLNSIALPNGYTQTLTYTSGALTSVSDSYSRTLTLSYTSGALTGVSTPDSATLTYAYNTVGGKKQLASVTYNTSPSTNQTYNYANTSYPFALTSITDENGNSFASWTYDGYGRCTDSQHAGGADEVQVSYPSATTRVVTNPLGEQETYTCTAVQGVPKVTQIDRAASSPVGAAT